VKLTIDHVSKRYGRNTLALQDFSLELGSGILGLLGPNGAGKTTLISPQTTFWSS
jgi:ABC-2 type transport system ATP-binding protein